MFEYGKSDTAESLEELLDCLEDVDVGNLDAFEPRQRITASDLSGVDTSDEGVRFSSRNSTRGIRTGDMGMTPAPAIESNAISVGTGTGNAQKMKPGDIVTQTDANTGETKQVTVMQNNTDGTMTVTDPATGEQKMVDPSFLQQKVSTKKPTKKALRQSLKKVFDDEDVSPTVRTGMAVTGEKSVKEKRVIARDEPMIGKDVGTNVPEEKPQDQQKTTEPGQEPEDAQQPEPNTGEYGDEEHGGKEFGNMYADPLKKVLLQPDVAVKIVQTMIDQGQLKPNLMVSLSAILPEGENLADAVWLKKNGWKLITKMANVIHADNSAYMCPGITDDIIAYEDGTMDREEIVPFFQRLIDCGLAWELQGSYGRMATNLIESGQCHQKSEGPNMLSNDTTQEPPVTKTPPVEASFHAEIRFNQDTEKFMVKDASGEKELTESETFKFMIKAGLTKDDTIDAIEDAVEGDTIVIE
jgi:hypothetical protein